MTQTPSFRSLLQVLSAQIRAALSASPEFEGYTLKAISSKPQWPHIIPVASYNQQQYAIRLKCAEGPVSVSWDYTGYRPAITVTGIDTTDIQNWYLAVLERLDAEYREHRFYQPRLRFQIMHTLNSDKPLEFDIINQKTEVPRIFSFYDPRPEDLFQTVEAYAETLPILSEDNKSDYLNTLLSSDSLNRRLQWSNLSLTIPDAGTIGFLTFQSPEGEDTFEVSLLSSAEEMIAEINDRLDEECADNEQQRFDNFQRFLSDYQVA